jgi:hypothetical protein
MKLKLALLVCATIGSAAPALAQTGAGTASAGPARSAPIGDAPTVYLGLFSVHQNGGRGHAALTSERVGDDISGTLSVNPCGGGTAGTGRHGVSAFATDAWRMSAKVLELNAQEAVIQLDSQRLRRAGQDETSAPESMTLTLKRGERKTLEVLTFAAGACDTSTSILGVLLATREELTGITPVDHARGSTSARSGVVERRMKKMGDSAPPEWGSVGMLAELWLVHTMPGRPDETRHLSMRILPFPMEFSFPAVATDSRSGSLSVKVDGTLESGRTPDGERRLHVTATRAVTAVTSARPVGESKPVVEGSTKTTVALPGPDEVISFELPPLRTADGVVLPDRWSVRLRLSQK